MERIATPNPGPNEPCPCGSGRRFCKCHKIPESSTIADFIAEYVKDPSTPILLIDETRFGKPEGFQDGERVLFAGVFTDARTMIQFGRGVEQCRQRFLDEQKRRRILKAEDVLAEGRLGDSLRDVTVEMLSSSQVTYWASSTPFMLETAKTRPVPAARLADGTAVNGQETPVVEMMSGLMAEKSEAVRKKMRLDTFIDASKQNGLNRDPPDKFTVYTVKGGGAPAVKGGQKVVLGQGVGRRIFAVRESTPLFGDWIMPPDLAAYLWRGNRGAVELLRAEYLLRGVHEFERLPGMAVAEEMVAYLVRQLG